MSEIASLSPNRQSSLDTHDFSTTSFALAPFLTSALKDQPLRQRLNFLCNLMSSQDKRAQPKLSTVLVKKAVRNAEVKLHPKDTNLGCAVPPSIRRKNMNQFSFLLEKLLTEGHQTMVPMLG